MSTFYETVYRPPTEANSDLLEVSVGCSYGKCTFCQLSNGTIPLQLVSSQALCDSLSELAEQGSTGTRLYLAGENVLAFKTQYLLDLFRLVKSYLPSVQEFAMYGRADDIAHKSEEQLTLQRMAGLDTVYLGVESGNAQVLLDCNKGETPNEIITQLQRLDKIAIRYGLSSILGLGGKKRWREHALDTARLYCQVSPKSIRVMTLTPWSGTPLATAVLSDQFVIASPQEILEEEYLLLESLGGISPCRFVGNHVSNLVPLTGNLPSDREKMLALLASAIEKGDFDLVQNPSQKW